MKKEDLFDKVILHLKCKEPKIREENSHSIYAEWVINNKNILSVYLEVFDNGQINYGSDFIDGTKKFFKLKTDGRLPNMFIDRLLSWIK